MDGYAPFTHNCTSVNTHLTAQLQKDFGTFPKTSQNSPLFFDFFF